MADFDLSQADQGEIQSDLDLFEALKPNNGPAQQDRRTGQALILKNQDRDPDSARLERGEDPDTSITLAIQQDEMAVFDQLQQTLQNSLDTNPETFNDQVQQVNGLIEQRAERAAGPISQETSVVDNLVRNSPIDINEKARSAMETRLALANDVAQMLENQGVLDSVLDFGGMMMPFFLTKDLADIDASELNWTNATSPEAFIIDFQSLPDERKRAVWPQVVDSVMRATGTNVAGVEVSDENVLQTAGILLRFLDPEGADRLSVDRIQDMLLSAADVIPAKIASSLIGHVAQTVHRTTNSAKMAATAGDATRAADVTIAAAHSEDVAKTANVNRSTVAMNALPLDRQALNPEQADGIAPAITMRLNEFQKQAEGVTRNIIEDQDLMRVGALNRFEKTSFIRSWEDKLQNRVSDRFNDEVQVSNLSIDNVTDEGFSAKYSLVREGTEQLRVDEKVLFTTDSNGNFNYTTREAGGFEQTIGSPAYWSLTKADAADFNDSFKSAGVTLDVAAGFQQRLQTMVDEAFEPVSGFGNRAMRADVEAVLLKGDVHFNENGTRGTVYDPYELAAGIDVGDRVVRLTDPAAVEAYYRARTVADQFWILENHAARRRLELNGFQNSIDLGEDGAVAVRVIENAGSAKQSFRNRSGNTGNSAYDEDLNDIVELTDELIDAEYDKGRVLVRASTDTPVRLVDDSVEHVDYIFVSRDRLKSLPDQTIHYKHGYVPKINKGVEYLVKENVAITKRGVPNAKTQKTLRFFASRKDADAFALKMAQKAVDEGRYPDLDEALKNIQAVADRELTPMQRVHESIGSSGGLFSGARSSEDILTGMVGRETERMGVFESLSRNARHLGSLVARNEARIGDEQRWLNTVEQFGVRNQGFEGTTLPQNEAWGRTLERERELIRSWNGVPTNDETGWQGMMQHMHDFVLSGARRVPGLANKDAVQSLLWLKHKDLAAAMKGATMHMMLGMLNPAQLVVQSSAATVALSRFPRIGAQAASYAFKMAALDNVKNLDTLATASKRLAKITDDTPLIEEIHTAWQRSGLRESVRTNADIDVSDKYGIATANALKRVSDASLYFYRHGELFNRRFSFTASYLDWKRKNPGKLPTKDDMLDINKDARLSMLELNAANRSFWQGGPNTTSFRQILGTMTQFQQVSAKSVELLIKGERSGGFSATERMRILAMQTALFGAAGIPAGGFIANEAADWLGADMDQGEINLWNQGLFIGSMLNALGADLDVANRVAAFGQIQQFVKDIMFDDNPLFVKMFGASGTVASRTWDTLKTLRPMMASVQAHEGITKAEMAVAMQVLGDPATATRNLTKAWIMHNSHVIRDRHGNPVDQRNYSLGTEIGVALGFRPSIETETRIMQLSNRDYDEIATSQADIYVRLAQKYIDAVQHGDAAQKDAAAMNLSATMKFMYATLAEKPHIIKRVQDAIQKKIESPSNIRERELKRFIERQMPGDVWDSAQADRQKWYGLPNAMSETAIVRPFERELEENK